MQEIADCKILAKAREKFIKIGYEGKYQKNKKIAKKVLTGRKGCDKIRITL